jgi:hypothetical protein
MVLRFRLPLFVNTKLRRQWPLLHLRTRSCDRLCPSGQLLQLCLENAGKFIWRKDGLGLGRRVEPIAILEAA